MSPCLFFPGVHLTCTVGMMPGAHESLEGVGWCIWFEPSCGHIKSGHDIVLDKIVDIPPIRSYAHGDVVHAIKCFLTPMPVPGAGQLSLGFAHKVFHPDLEDENAPRDSAELKYWPTGEHKVVG